MNQASFGFWSQTMSEPTLKVLTVRQPWAWGILHGRPRKRFENRSWVTKHRGPLVIHAGTSRADLREGRKLVLDAPPDDQLVFGAAIGIVTLSDILAKEDCPEDPFVEGPFCWILDDPEPIDPVPMAGRLGLFEVPESRLGLAARGMHYART